MHRFETQKSNTPPPNGQCPSHSLDYLGKDNLPALGIDEDAIAWMSARTELKGHEGQPVISCDELPSLLPEYETSVWEPPT
jgi:hypothetical protein